MRQALQGRTRTFPFPLQTSPPCLAAAAASPFGHGRCAEAAGPGSRRLARPARRAEAGAASPLGGAGGGGTPCRGALPQPRAAAGAGGPADREGAGAPPAACMPSCFHLLATLLQLCSGIRCIWQYLPKPFYCSQLGWVRAVQSMSRATNMLRSCLSQRDINGRRWLRQEDARQRDADRAKREQEDRAARARLQEVTGRIRKLSAKWVPHIPSHADHCWDSAVEFLLPLGRPGAPRVGKAPLPPQLCEAGELHGVLGADHTR